MNSCEDCPYYNGMTGKCTVLEEDGELCPIVSGKAELPEEADNEQ